MIRCHITFYWSAIWSQGAQILFMICCRGLLQKCFCSNFPPEKLKIAGEITKTCDFSRFHIGSNFCKVHFATRPSLVIFNFNGGRTPVGIINHLKATQRQHGVDNVNAVCLLGDHSGKTAGGNDLYALAI